MSPPRVTVLSYAMTASSAAPKARYLAEKCNLTIVQPDRWPWYAGECGIDVPKARVVSLPVHLAGQHHFHWYSGLGVALRASSPALFYYDQEPWSISTAQAVRVASRLPCAIVGFTWQNLIKRYPPPFTALERWVYKHTALMIAGNEAAAEILVGRGYRGLVRVIPQFGVDLATFKPGTSTRAALRLPLDGLAVGYVGRLVSEKGVETALKAVAMVPESRLVLVGVGPLQRRLQVLAQALGVARRVHFLGGFGSDQIPRVLRGLDALILPSRTTRYWKEQFGRVLIEAMAMGVPVIGSDSGEIPRVIGGCGLIFPEDDVDGCARAIRALLDPRVREDLSRRGRARVESRYTQERLAEEVWKAWCEAYAAWKRSVG